MLDLRSAARALGGEVSGGQINCPGPGHSPKDRSLSVKLDPKLPDGFVVCSHAGDDAIACRDHVRSKLGLEPFKPNGGGGDAKRQVDANYDYTDEHGELLFQVTRWRPKGFSQRRPDGRGGWINSLGDVRRVLYRLPELLEAVASGQPVYIAEGEKDVDALMRLGVSATCNPGGAEKWRDDYSRSLQGADVIIVPDDDKVGEDHLNVVARSLLGTASRIRVLRLASHDASDWISAGGTVEQLWKISDEAPAWGETEPSSSSDEAPSPVALSLADWIERDIPPRDLLLGELLHTTCRAMIIGPTGLGKTMWGLAVALAIAGNKGFLKWCAHRAGRVLYIDGEMSARLMKRRLIDAVRRAGNMPDGLMVLSREDFPDMPPLNTEAGQRWLDAFIERHGPFDLIIFDNLQALLVGNMKDEELWAEILPWVRSLTRRAIAQIWFHHTGHDEGHGYGSKAKEWQLDLVGLMKRVEDKETDLAFTLEFTKARERDPDNRDQFAPATIRLVSDRWLLGDVPAEGGISSRSSTIAKAALEEAIIREGSLPPANPQIPDHTLTVSEAAWRRFAYGRGISQSDTPRAQQIAFTRARQALQTANLIGTWEGQCWLVAGVGKAPRKSHE